MCVRCYSGYAAGLSRKMLLQCTTIASGSSSSVLVNLPLHLWVLVVQLVGIQSIAALFCCCRGIYRLNAEPQFWNEISHCAQISVPSAAQDASLDDVFFLMPHIECPETWREFARLQILKKKWIFRVAANCTALSKFLSTYRRLSNPRFGAARFFAHNEVYFLLKMVTSFSIEEIEVSIHRSRRRNHQTLQSGAISERFWDDDDKEFCVRIHPQPTAGDEQHNQLSFADVGEGLAHLSVDEATCFSTVQPQQNMPFEVYFVL